MIDKKNISPRDSAYLCQQPTLSPICTLIIQAHGSKGKFAPAQDAKIQRAEGRKLKVKKSNLKRRSARSIFPHHLRRCLGTMSHGDPSYFAFLVQLLDHDLMRMMVPLLRDMHQQVAGGRGPGGVEIRAQPQSAKRTTGNSPPF